MTRIAGVFNHSNALDALTEGFEALNNVEYRNIVCDESLRNGIASSGELNNGFAADTELTTVADLFEYVESGLTCDKGLDNSYDGGFAFAWWREDSEEVVIARDILGIKPLWFVHHADGFAFASERKMLEAMGFSHAILLEPRVSLRYDIKRDRLQFEYRPFFSIEPELNEDLSSLKSQLLTLLRDSIRRRIPTDEKFGVLFSGGLDSTLIAHLCRGADFCCYTVAVEDPGMKTAEDVEFATQVAAELGFKLRVKHISVADMERYLRIVIPTIEDTDVMKVSVALPLYAACELAAKDGIKTVLYGLGTEELFAGYERHKRVPPESLNRECLSGLMCAYERDLYRDDTIARSCGVSLRAPFLSTGLVEFGLRIPATLKIANNVEKWILREIAREEGLNEVAGRKKRAIQYGSNTIKAIDKLTKERGYRYKREYLRRFYPSRAIKLGCIFNASIDSVFTLWLLQKASYQVDCLIQDGTLPCTFTAEASGLPVITHSDLTAALIEAKTRYGIDAIATPVTWDETHKHRIEGIAKEARMEVISPLWHINYETELRVSLIHGFEAILCAVRNEHRNWLGKRITVDDVAWLVEHRGQYQTFVVNAPVFQSRIEIEKCEWETHGEEIRLVIKEAELCSGSYSLS